MQISLSGFAPISAPDRSDVRESRASDDTSSESFAGMLNGAMQTKAPAPAPMKHKDGTSELDSKDESDKAESAGTDDDDSKVKKSSSKHRVRATTEGDVVRSLDVLDPTLQDKLARVMARMKDETGLDVSVAETYRSQSRQDTLFAQGRQTPGPVVTWTQNSQHTAGRAVDLVVNGAVNSTDAYARLQRIANEEGLRTLGARDPGHVELPATAASSNGTLDLTSLNPVAPADASGPGQMSITRLAQLAKVADVAQPAQVARVATVARPGVEAQPVKVDGNAGPSGTAAPISVSGVSIGTAAQERSGSGRDGRGQSGSGDSRGYGAMAAAVALRQQNAGGFNVAGVSPDVGTAAAQRAAVIEALQDAPARPLSQITMALDAGNGTTDRIQLSLRGASLNARIDAADPRAAQAMTARGDELARALTKDGIDLQSLHVRSTAGAVGGGLAAQSTQTSSDSSTSSRFERGQVWQQQNDRQRSQQDKRNQQREQRGGQTQ